MKLNSKLAVVGAPLFGVLAAGLALSASVHSPTGVSPKAGVVFASALDDEDGESGDEADEAREMDLRDVMPMAKLSLSKAIALALAAQPGAAVEAGLEGEFDAEDKVEIFYEVMIVGADKKLHEVKLSHLNGKVLGNSIENDEDEVRELVGFNEALRHSELTLIQLIASAGNLVNGQAASASLEFDDEGPECEVLIVNGRYLVDVDVEARAGHILEVELAGRGDNEEDDEGHSWDDDEGDHDGVQHGHQDEDDDGHGDDDDEEEDDD